jgi:hypothetical protein
MDVFDEHVKPLAQGLTRWRWLGVGVVLGFFLGFVDTLLIAALLGTAGIKVPAYFGVPTTFTGYFFTGMILGGLAPREIVWEVPLGILVCALLLVLGLMGLKGQGVLSFILNFIFLPATAVGVCYLGMRVARRAPRKNPVASPADGSSS